jgi:hypothetical protein
MYWKLVKYVVERPELLDRRIILADYCEDMGWNKAAAKHRLWVKLLNKAIIIWSKYSRTYYAAILGRWYLIKSNGQLVSLPKNLRVDLRREHVHFVKRHKKGAHYA